MARIRSIKPEFPQSESMGNVSRDARLTFLQLWTIADDSGRLRGNSRMLASLLFPYDDDAPSLIDGWLSELEGEGCIVRYKADGQSYIEICKWLIHQKIDKPSASKIPAFARIREDSRSVVVGRDQGRDQGEDIREEESPREIPAPSNPIPKPTAKKKTALPADFKISERVQEWAHEKGYTNLETHYERFVGSCKAKGYSYVDWDEGFMGAIRDNWAKVPTPITVKPRGLQL